MKKLLYLPFLLVIMISLLGCSTLDDLAENGKENMEKENAHKSVDNISSTFETGETIFSFSSLTGRPITYRFGGFVNDKTFSIVVISRINASNPLMYSLNYSLDSDGFFLPDDDKISPLFLKIVDYNIEKNTITFEAEGTFK